MRGLLLTWVAWAAR